MQTHMYTTIWLLGATQIYTRSADVSATDATWYHALNHGH